MTERPIMLIDDNGDEVGLVEDVIPMQVYKVGSPGWNPDTANEPTEEVPSEPVRSNEEIEFEQMLQEGREDISEEEAVRRAAIRKAEYAQILDRGIVASRLDTSFIPPHLEGFWSRNNSDDISSFTSVGALVWRGGRGMHSQGDGTCVVGDLILMVIRKEDRKLLEEVKKEKTARKVGTLERPSAARAEYLLRAKSNPDIPVIDESVHSRNNLAKET